MANQNVPFRLFRSGQYLIHRESINADQLNRKRYHRSGRLLTSCPEQTIRTLSNNNSSHQCSTIVNVEHNDLLRSDSGNSSLSITDSLSSGSGSEDCISDHSSYRSITFEPEEVELNDDLVRISIYVPESLSEVIGVNRVIDSH